MPRFIWWGSDFTRRRGSQIRFFVCLFVTLLSVRDCAPDFAMKAWECRNDFDTVGQGKVCSCVPVFNFLRLLPNGDTTKCRNPKAAKIGVFAQPQDDRINRSIRNFAGKRVPWVCYSSPNLALIGQIVYIFRVIPLPWGVQANQ